MPRAANPKVGEMACECCGRSVFVRRTGSGKLQYTCDACDGSAYAEPGGDRMRAWSSNMTPIKGAEPEPAAPPAAKPEPAPAPAPSKRPASSAFELGAL